MLKNAWMGSGKHIIIKTIFLIIIFSIFRVSASVKNEIKNNFICGYIALLKYNDEQRKIDLQLPHDIIDHIISFITHPILLIHPNFLSWHISYDPDKKHETLKTHNKYSHEKFKNIYGTTVTIANSNSNAYDCLNSITHIIRQYADLKELLSNKLTLVSDTELSRIKSSIFNDKHSADLSNRLPNNNPFTNPKDQLPCMFIIKFYDIISSILSNRTNTLFHDTYKKKLKKQFLSELSKNPEEIESILPVFDQQLIIIVKKTKIVFAYYQQNNKSNDQYFISNLHSIEPVNKPIDAIIPLSIPINEQLDEESKEVVSWGLYYDEQKIKIIKYKNRNNTKKIGMIFEGSMPKKEKISRVSDLTVLTLCHTSISSIIESFKTKNPYYYSKNMLREKIKALELSLNNIFMCNSGPFIATFLKNNQISSKNYKYSTQKQIIARNIMRALIFSVVSGIIFSIKQNISFHRLLIISAYNSCFIFIAISLLEIGLLYKYNISLFQLIHQGKYTPFFSCMLVKVIFLLNIQYHLLTFGIILKGLTSIPS